MTEKEKRQLVIEHAHLTAAHAAGDESVKIRLQEIQVALQLSAPEIAVLALKIYMEDY